MKLTIACLLVLALIAGAACTQATEAPPETELPPATTRVGVTEEDIEAARQVVFAYRAAFNEYDVEGALAFLEESHRAERAEEIASDIGLMETYGIQLGVEEEAEPTVTADGKIEIYILVDVPVLGQPDRHIAYQVIKIEGEWKICHSEDID